MNFFKKFFCKKTSLDKLSDEIREIVGIDILPLSENFEKLTHDELSEKMREVDTSLELRERFREIATTIIEKCPEISVVIYGIKNHGATHDSRINCLIPLTTELEAVANAAFGFAHAKFCTIRRG